MHNTDPYAPPASGFTTPLARPGESGALEYSGFWQRVGAYLIDMLIVAPLSALDFFLGGEVRYLQLYLLGPSQLIAFFMFVYMVRKYGGSPGKLLLGLCIRMADGSPVTLKAALLRYAPMWLLGLLMAVAMIMAALSMPDSSHLSLDYMARSLAVAEYLPGWFGAVSVLLQVWVFASLITILCNKKRRAIHDFIAGTVVVRKP